MKNAKNENKSSRNPDGGRANRFRAVIAHMVPFL
jgi:hypothetical protein